MPYLRSRLVTHCVHVLSIRMLSDTIYVVPRVCVALYMLQSDTNLYRALINLIMHEINPIMHLINTSNLFNNVINEIVA